MSSEICAVSGEIGGTYRWGGEKNEFSGYIKGEVHDDRGNSVRVKIEHDSDGKGSATVSAKHDDQSEKK